MGMIAAVKMVLMSKLIFAFTNINLKIPTKMLNKIQALINKFIWEGKRARIRQTILEKDTQSGGLAIFNIKHYFYAAILSAYLHWWKMPSDSIRMKLEQNKCSMPFSDCVLLDKDARTKLGTVNGIAKILEKVWSH